MSPVAPLPGFQGTLSGLPSSKPRESNNIVFRDPCCSIHPRGKPLVLGVGTQRVRLIFCQEKRRSFDFGARLTKLGSSGYSLARPPETSRCQPLEAAPPRYILLPDASSGHREMGL